jgi:hypothetical protein
MEPFKATVILYHIGEKINGYFGGDIMGMKNTTLSS